MRGKWLGPPDPPGRISDFPLLPAVIRSTTTAMEKPFRKDLSHRGWDQVYQRQALRAELLDDWVAALSVGPGDRVLEIGAGPGFFSLALAERVGPTGMVYAVDRSAEALAQLERRQRERAIAQIERIVGDAATLDPAAVKARAALLTMVLHHADDPAGILANVARLLPPGGLAVIGEFHPDGPCAVGPSRQHRLAPEQVEAWCDGAGLVRVAYKRQTPEHYMIVAERRA